MAGNWGGARVGAGRKPEGTTAVRLHGSRQRRTRGSRKRPSAERFEWLEYIGPPADLPAEQRAVWDGLAPHARATRTLVGSTAAAFRDLCEAIVLKRALLAKIEADGLTYLKVMVDGAGVEHEELKAHPLLTQHRGMMQRVEAGLMRFKLAPMGKEILPLKEPEDAFAEFDQPLIVLKDGKA